MFTTQLRKIGNSQGIIVPKDELERLGLEDGETVTVEVRPAKVTVRPVLAKHLREASDKALAWGKEGLHYLAEN